MTPLYLQALEGGLTDVQGAGLPRRLSNWDYDMHPEQAPMIFEVMWLELNKALFLDELGERNFP
ncbi:MAG: hypothetical protein R2751_12805 [Bacteroidales bacterium]